MRTESPRRWQPIIIILRRFSPDLCEKLWFWLLVPLFVLSLLRDFHGVLLSLSFAADLGPRRLRLSKGVTYMQRGLKDLSPTYSHFERASNSIEHGSGGLVSQLKRQCTLYSSFSRRKIDRCPCLGREYINHSVPNFSEPLAWDGTADGIIEGKRRSAIARARRPLSVSRDYSLNHRAWYDTKMSLSSRKGKNWL